MRVKHAMLLTALGSLLSAACGTSATVSTSASENQGPAPTSQISIPELTSPADGDSVPRPEDPPCQGGFGCTRVNVNGRIPVGLTPFLAVAPLAAAPRKWIQPLVAGVRRDGRFTSLVFLGEKDIGIGESYTIFVFACKDSARFRDGDVIEAMPTDCLISEPVTVRRTR